MSEYTITVFNPDHWNEFEHRQVVFTRLAKAGNGKTTPISQVLQLWDVETDSLIIELTPTISLDDQPNTSEKLKDELFNLALAIKEDMEATSTHQEKHG